MGTKGKVAGIIANLVIVEVDGPVSQNEICYIISKDVKLMAEVIRIGGKNAYIQVFESTRGLKTGTDVEFTGHMLEATLGPGILSKNLQGYWLEMLLGIFLVAMSLIFLLKKDLIIPPNKKNATLGGVFSGFTAGLLGTGGAIRGLTMAAFNLEKSVFIATKFNNIIKIEILTRDKDLF